MRLQMLDPGSHPDFLDLPWDDPLADWPDERVVDVRGSVHRHVVRCVPYGATLYVLKELPPGLAAREFRLLRELAARGLPVVSVVGVVSERAEACDGQDVLITRHLDFSLPYRALIGSRRVPYVRDRLLDALAGLLVRIHLAGFFWGDCSLSNTLFRRDAGALAAYVVDTETGELYERLSVGQRTIDLDIAVENIAGGLADLQAAGRLDASLDPLEMAEALVRRYEQLWDELTADETFPAGDSYRIGSRINRLNDLGFDVEELELRSTDEGRRLRMVPKVVELGYHSPRLAQLTGVAAGENQARRLLNDIRAHGIRLEEERGRPFPEAVVAARWLAEVFEPAVEAIPPELRTKLESAEAYHQLLEHRWFLSEAAGADVGLEAAVASYVESVLRHAPDERTLVVAEDLPD